MNKEKIMDRKQAIEQLQAGEIVKFRAHGNSMTPRIPNGSLLTIKPVTCHEIKVGDAVFCKVKGRVFVHKVYAIGQIKGKGDKPGGLQFKIGNNHGHINGWCKSKDIYGVLIGVEK